MTHGLHAAVLQSSRPSSLSLLLQRLSGVPPPQSFGHPLRGPRPPAAPVTFVPLTPSILEENDTVRVPLSSKRKRPQKEGATVWALLASHTLRCCMSVWLFVAESVGASRSATLLAIYTSLLAWFARTHAAWRERMAAAGGLTSRLSSACLGTLARTTSAVRLKETQVADLLRRALSFEGKLNTCAAIRCYEAASKLSPDDATPLVGLAKCISDRVFDHDVNSDANRARTMATQAVHLSERAIALQPDNPRAHLASAVALGRLALWSPNQRKIELSRTVRERVITCLALSPDDDVALHVLGRWEYEMCCVGFAVRLIIKMVYGGLEVGNLDAAHRCLSRAIELRPDRLVHRVVMARILLRQGRRAEAEAELDVALRARVEDVNSVHERAEAAAMMRKLGRPVPEAAAQPAAPLSPGPVSPMSPMSPHRRCSWSVEALPVEEVAS